MGGLGDPALLCATGACRRRMPGGSGVFRRADARRFRRHVIAVCRCVSWGAGYGPAAGGPRHRRRQGLFSLFLPSAMALPASGSVGGPSSARLPDGAEGCSVNCNGKFEAWARWINGVARLPSGPCGRHGANGTRRMSPCGDVFSSCLSLWPLSSCRRLTSDTR